MNNLTKKELLEKIQNFDQNGGLYFFDLKQDLFLNQNFQDILFDIEELLDKNYIIRIMSLVERGDWEGDYEGFRDGCYMGIKDIEIILKLLPKKNQQKYLQKVEILWSLYDDMVEEAERCIAEAEEEEENLLITN